MGYDLGMNTAGGFRPVHQRAGAVGGEVAGGFILARQHGLRHGRIHGGAVRHEIMAGGLTKEAGEVLVTGATGGVGSVAVAILAKLGFNVVAATGKADEKDFLTGLGAKTIISARRSQRHLGKAASERPLGRRGRHGRRQHSRHRAQISKIRRPGRGLRQCHVR